MPCMRVNNSPMCFCTHGYEPPFCSSTGPQIVKPSVTENIDIQPNQTIEVNQIKNHTKIQATIQTTIQTTTKTTILTTSQTTIQSTNQTMIGMNLTHDQNQTSSQTNILTSTEATITEPLAKECDPNPCLNDQKCLIFENQTFCFCILPFKPPLCSL